MSACMMVAAQLYGQPRDRVYHVLVSPEFESSSVFFYPPPRHPLRHRAGQGSDPGGFVRRAGEKPPQRRNGMR